VENFNELLDQVETSDLWELFQKDWLIEIRALLRTELPDVYQLLVDENDKQYSLLIRRAPENRIVAALEIISPTNKRASGRLDREKFLNKRDGFFEAGVSYLEIDALRKGQRLLPTLLAGLAAFDRNAWTAFHHGGQRRVRGCGSNGSDPLPVVPWMIESGLTLTLDFTATLRSASEFNRWPQLV
jgi:hypothetical protein